MKRKEYCPNLIANPFAATIVFILIAFSLIEAFVLLRNYTIIYYDVHTLFALLLSSIVVSKIVKKHCFDFGLRFSEKSFSQIVFGFLLAFGFYSIFTLLAHIFGAQITIVKEIAFNLFFKFFLVIIISAIVEELLFRGILFQIFLSHYNKSIIIIISSVIFAVVHLGNLNITYLAMFNIFLAGIVFSIMYVRTNSLWLPISFHFFWNAIQSLVCGQKISGNSIPVSIIEFDITTINPLFLGGDFGPEGGIITTIWLLASIPMILIFTQKKNRRY